MFSSTPLLCGVTKRLILGLVIFYLYVFSVGHPLNIFSGVSNQCFADDMKLYISVKPNNLDSLFYLTDCFTDITNWMSLN